MDKNKISIVILAAGKGSRMKSPKAKVLHTVCGKEMLYHIIKSSREISNDITVVVAHQKDAVVKQISSYFDDINFVIQDADNFPGTGGAMKNISVKNEKVLVLNGDMPLLTADALQGFLGCDNGIIMSIFDLQNPDGYGRVIIENNQVQRIVEQKDASAKELSVTTVNAGIYAFSKNILEKYIPLLSNDNAQKEYYLTDVISMARADGLNISPLLVDEERFKGVNSKKDLSDAEEIMQDRIKTSLMESGVIMQLPSTIYIEEGVTFEGECIVENGCRITGNSKIINSHIKAHSVIEDSIVKNSDVGPLAHLRPACVIEDTHIGNFVEIKKSTLKGVKAGHLSYIGDATVDEGTNIGAGVITCNYDGIKKHETIIGKNVFIGSDSQLVAPITIEDDVMIAAGTTVTSGRVESGVLAISRTKLRTIKDFYYKFFNK
ncbi:MAG: UDP-N-acetylglucosamine diphosphorylase/glucosamine-1-phosphate N-acetyltransferase [Sulfurimonas sp. RIFCSPHIGHO2_12_FULL_36_9]|uniref:bifunctional UDP-N-acetylglucosamine diphosphorylase/glucosamine-1-phosphate N-acetyltransferase GlmU n=1 Tax=Sulfurimonas sp. RIFCSPLOWO2_12_36_12 TaxID=1802253 RepID=UPI0008B36D05|nr:bifunctional UDP-N-acetylglucosamine diphosphorylase/glucosamine-1-phosphate N-acetyltransferase GlmU [Sulfurimonas sp. RIFCSPLOWO2_12_36_12]OHD98527.1 MAG: UDP-N-acetylglucosamine diphosphorylase/glucosamine-1-phosphate N-acetyltransferase [Sulfurimonas sp. RIFCSPHIGHO2_12_FULL_36_9]OHE00861.1 MAG: UDP-N-acetylglucosamine diphosphorylase/glucosamine-1-phosphate N-acetyltransferase [Sulfurimonas sp. RIFCSPLOWO2_12_36_12]OHE06834.1 MAG: UDP-N-acetylglucosamine diphosphorylase/glucosamine-1-pho